MTIRSERASSLTPEVVALLDSVPTSSVLMDLTATIECWNGAAERLTGYTKAEATGQRFAELLRLSDEEKPKLERMATMAASRRCGNASCRAQFIGRHKNGSTLALAVVISAIELGGTTVLGGFVADLADAHGLEARVLQAQRMEIAGRLAAGIAHDFNNLLVVVLGNTGMLLQQLPFEDSRRELVTEVLEAGRRGAAMARQLVTFSRCARDEVRIVDPNVVLSEMRPILQRLVGEDVRLVANLRITAGAVRMNPSHLEQMVMNLVINARDALPAGGTITLETARLDVVAVSSGNADELAQGSYVTMTVRDDGIGMDEDTQRRIFEPYFTTKGAHGGSGLGLSTCRTLAERYGGRISVSSRLGQGSQFVVHLPAATAIEGELTPTRASDQRVRGHETILVVEDDDAVRNLLRRVLGTQGYSVVDTWSAAAALELLERSPNAVHLVLTDLVLPGVGGRELCNRIAALNPELPKLLMSGYGPDVWTRHGVTDESDVVQKPFDIVALLPRIRELLDAR